MQTGVLFVASGVVENNKIFGMEVDFSAFIIFVGLTVKIIRDDMKMIKPLLIAAACLAVAGCACNKNVVIVSTNDMHSAIDAFPSLATVVGEQRAANRGRVVLVDAGDRWTGNPYVDMAPEPGQPIMELMNELGYDAATFGNHEFDRGTALLEKRTQEADFPVVLANMHTLSSPLSQPRPYATLHSKGFLRRA